MGRFALLLTWLLSACRVAPSQEEPPPPTPTVIPAPAEGFYYGVVQVLANAEQFRSRDEIADRMQQIKALGGSIVLQEFPPELTVEEWKSYLDVAQQEGLRVSAKPGPIAWNPEPNDLSPIYEILDGVAGHPALYAFHYLHEPFELYTTEQIQGMYRAIKERYPEVRLGVGLSGTLGRFRTDPARQFADDICDLCLVNMKAFQADAGRSNNQGLARLLASAPIIAQADPDAELWSSVQIWEPRNPMRREFRVPSPEEMQSLFCTLRAQLPELRGFLWETWDIDVPNQGTLKDEALAPQRQMAETIYKQCVLNTP